MAKCIFISTGFSGKTEEEVRKTIKKAEERAKEKYPEFADAEFIHNYNYTGDGIERHPDNQKVRFIAEAIRKISNCDGVLFVNNWPDYRGCQVEMFVCDAYGIPTYEIDV